MTGRRLLFGRNAVLEAVESGTVRRIMVLEDDLRPGTPLFDLVECARGQGVGIDTTSRSELNRLAGSVHHQGVVAWAKPLPQVALEDVIDETQNNPTAIVMLLDGVTDPQNLGSILRVGESAGVEAVVIGKHRSAPLTPAASRISAGASEHVPLVQVTNLSRALDQLKAAGYWAVGTSPDGQQSLWEADLVGKLVLVLGSEGRGIGPLVAKHCDQLVRIPMYGRLESLNVSVAAGIILYEVRRKAKSAGHE